MLKFYHVKCTTFHNDTEIGVETCRACIEESEKPEIQNISVDWDNLDEIEHKYLLESRFVVYNRKKGRVVSFSHRDWPGGFRKNFKDFKDVREWTGCDLNITLQIEYIEYNPSINEVLKYWDGERAIKYLVERGLSIVK